MSNTAKVKCSDCGGTVFSNGVIFRKVSKLIAGTTKDGLVPITVPYCIDCGLPMVELLPNEIKDEYIDKKR